MIGLVIASQGRLAFEFVAALQHVYGQPLPQLEALVIDDVLFMGSDKAIEQDKALERDRQRLSDAIARVDSGDGVVVLTEMFEATSTNLAIAMLGRVNIEVLGGISLPTLVKLVKVRDLPLRSAVAYARDSGRRHITASADVLAK
jgi:PTS system mannose-specific IIA component